MPLPTYISQAGGEGTGNVTVTLPAHVADDILVLITETANEAVTAPSGWAEVAASPQGTGTAGGGSATRAQVFWLRAASAAETDPTVTDPGDHVLVRVLLIRGCRTSGSPIDVAAGDVESAGSSSISIPGATTATDDCLVMLVCTWADDSSASNATGISNADLASISQRRNAGTTQGNGGGFYIATANKATAGAYGATTGSLSLGSSAQGRISFALASLAAPAFKPAWARHANQVVR